MKKKILIVSTGIPNHGGAATTMFNLEKLLKNDFETKLVYFNKNDLLENNHRIPDNIFEINRSKNSVWKLIRLLENIYLLFLKLFGINEGRAKQIITDKQKSNIISLINLSDLNRLLLFNKFSPDIIVSNVPSYFKLLSRIKTKHKIIIINGSTEMSLLSKKDIDATYFLKNPEILSWADRNTYDYIKLQVIFNSFLTKKIYETINVKMMNNSIHHFNLTPISKTANKPFHEREIHLAYFVSNTSRKIKNPELAVRIFQEFSEFNKICIGRGSSMFENIEKTTVNNIIQQEDLFELMNNVRLIIIPSYYDSSPGILTEAILRGCNVLVSKNVGWSEYLDQECVVDDFNDFNEWKNKTAYLMDHHKSNYAFTRLVSQSPTNILSFFKGLDNPKVP